MNSREIVLRTLAYESPERVARSFYDGDFAWTSYDVATPATDWMEVGGGRWERMDEWGNVWARVDRFSKGEVVKGVLDSLEDADALTFPDFSNPADYAPARAARAAHPDRYLIGGMPGFAFNIARKLRRIDHYLLDLLENRSAIHALHDRIDALLETMIVQYAASGVDAVMFPEDWGTQSGLMIAPALWREEFFPRFLRLCALAKASGVAVWMHSCGQISAIVPDLMRAGIAVLQFDQPELHGLETLAAHQGRGKITFWCPVDIQQILPRRDPELIRARARAMLDLLWKGRGGFIAGYYGDNESLGLEPEWQEYACKEFLHRGLRKVYQ